MRPTRLAGTFCSVASWRRATLRSSRSSRLNARVSHRGGSATPMSCAVSCASDKVGPYFLKELPFFAYPLPLAGGTSTGNREPGKHA